MPFEERLAATIAGVLGATALGACGGNLERMCEGAEGPEDYVVSTGFVTVDPGAACPPVAEADLEVHGCGPIEWKGTTCRFVRVDHDQVLASDGDGGDYFVNATAADTEQHVISEVVDVCLYEGVFLRHGGVCGRPLLLAGEPVVAEVALDSAGWSQDACESCVLSDADRRLLAVWWLRAALLEHASVASFACFSLDLVRFGAPPDLVEGAHRAALDEIQHAKACFALASAYSGRPLGPGPLAPAGELTLATSLCDLAERLVREGCVGETLSAVDAAARLAEARDPAVRAALEAIVRDESVHAALAWRALRWSLDQDADGSIRRRVVELFAVERDRVGAEGDDPPSNPCRAHGLLTPIVRTQVLRGAWEDVLAPSASDLG